MGRTRFKHWACPIGRALDEVGDWWSLLIVREAMMGAERFSDFERELGISKNILAKRLAQLVDADVLERDEVGKHGQRAVYRLTDKGRELFVVLTALRQWGEKWIYGEATPPARLVDAATGRNVRRLQVEDADGNPVALSDTEVVVCD